jgi:hypothetical protein
MLPGLAMALDLAGISRTDAARGWVEAGGC